VIKKSRDKKYALVNFPSREIASRVIAELNYTKLDDVPIRMSWSDPETKDLIKKGEGNLFIHGLDESIEVSQIHEAFSNFGEIISCKIKLEKDKRTGKFVSCGFGYIQFRSKEDAEKAKMDLEDASINGKQIEIEDYVRKPKKDPKEIFTNVLIKPLPAERVQTEEDIAKYLEQYGEITSIKLEKKDKNGNPLVDKTDGKEKVFVYCNFKRHEDALRATEEFKDFEGIPIQVLRQMPKKERQELLKQQSEEFRRLKNKETQGRNCYVRGFGKDVSDEELKEFFKQFGEIESVKIARDPLTGESKQFGYVLFQDKEGLQKAIKESIDKKLKSNDNLFVATFKPKKVRKAEKAPEDEQDQKLSEDKKTLKKMLMDHNIVGEEAALLLKSVSNDQVKGLVAEGAEEFFEKWLDAQYYKVKK